MRKLILALVISTFLVSGCSDDETTRVNIEISEDVVASNGFTINWEPLEDALYYDVMITPDVWEQSTMVSNETSITFDNLLADTEYTVLIEAGSSLEQETIIGEGSINITTEAVRQEFVGTWEYNYSTLVESYVLNGDGTGKYIYDGDESDIIWSAGASEFAFKLLNENGGGFYYYYEYSFNSDNTILTLDGTNYFLQE
ncbi:fibronectin type III domain-containing protein [Marinilabilia salmonicolor]|uniref:fibronectin type III domain-containing protein n=1 Tax=Marinilabilia salmonicolor TaxID=989 RepID=UPI00029B40F5|nr:fibronectin type III domain-containing protein [Marinilabilia salmonicolor]